MDYNKRKDDLACAFGTSLALDMDIRESEWTTTTGKCRRWLDAYADIRAALDVLRDLPVLIDWAREHGCKSIGELLELWHLTDNTEEGSLEDYVTFGRPASAAMEAAEAEAETPAAPTPLDVECDDWGADIPPAPAGRHYLPGLKTVGVSQEKLGNLVGVSYGTVGVWERVQASVDEETVQRICEALHCTPEDLYSGVAE